MRTSSRIMLNAVTKWGAMFINALVGLLLVSFLLQQLGKEGYGLIAIVGVIVSMSAIADFGLRGAMSRHLAEQVAVKNTRRFNELASTGLLVYLSMGSLMASLGFIFAPLLTEPFKIPEFLQTQAVFLIRWYGSASILLSFILPTYVATITSNNRFDLQNYIDTSIGVLRGVLIFVVLGLTSAGLYGWAGVTLASRVLQLLLTRYFARQVRPDLEIKFRNARRNSLTVLLSLGGMLFLLHMTVLLGEQADPIILTTILGPAAVALYKPALVLVMAALPLVNAMVHQLHPLATGYYTTGQAKELQSVLIRGTRYTLLMAIPVCVILGILAQPIAKIWLFSSLGDDFQVTARVIAGWALIHFFMYASGAQWPVLVGMNRLSFLVWTQLPLGIVNIISSIIIVRYTSLGVPGVIIPTIVIGMIRRPVIVVYTARVVGLRAIEYFLKSYLRPILVLLILAAITIGLRFAININSLAVLVACVVFIGICWLPLCWWLGFDDNDRLSFKSLLQRILDTLRQYKAVENPD